jgi:hypothetical protein
LEAKQVAEGEPLVLQVIVRWAQGWSPELDTAVPRVEGLAAVLVEERSLDGETATSLQTWELSGPAGSYLLPPLKVVFVSPEGSEREMESAALFADIGTGGPRSVLAPMALAPIPEQMPWWPFAAVAGLLFLGTGVWWWRREDPSVQPPPPVPPDVAALATWRALQGDGELDDHALAVGLSALFRRYLEQVLPISATTATSREILASASLTAALKPPVRRLLTATDLIKYARKGGGDALFDQLDADLRKVIETTRPQPDPVPGEA